MSFEPSCPASLFFTQSLNIIFSHFCKHRWGFIAVWFDYKATHVLSAKLSLVYEISIMGLQLYCRGHTAERGRREREWEENNNNNNNTKCSQDWLEFAVFYLLRHTLPFSTLTFNTDVTLNFIYSIILIECDGGLKSVICTDYLRCDLQHFVRKSFKWAVKKIKRERTSVWSCQYFHISLTLNSFKSYRCSSHS